MEFAKLFFWKLENLREFDEQVSVLRLLGKAKTSVSISSIFVNCQELFSVRQCSVPCRKWVSVLLFFCKWGTGFFSSSMSRPITLVKKKFLLFLQKLIFDSAFFVQSNYSLLFRVAVLPSWKNFLVFFGFWKILFQKFFFVCVKKFFFVRKWKTTVCSCTKKFCQSHNWKKSDCFLCEKYFFSEKKVFSQKKVFFSLKIWKLGQTNQVIPSVILFFYEKNRFFSKKNSKKSIFFEKNWTKSIFFS